MEQLDIAAGSKVLLLWGASHSPESVKDSVNQLAQKVGSSGKVQVEHIERLQLCKFICGMHPWSANPNPVGHTNSRLTTTLQCCKGPGRKVHSLYDPNLVTSVPKVSKP